MARAEFVFGYGSLAAWGERESPPTRGMRPEEFVAELRGHRRLWGVAMDNRRDLPGYKWYAAPDGRRPAVFVAFLDVVECDDADTGVTGLCRPVDAAALAALDRRERNYERVDVSDRVAGGGTGARVWTYRGSAAGRARLAAGRRTGTAVIDAGYLRAVQRGFAALGQPTPLAPDGLPVMDLIRHDLR